MPEGKANPLNSRLKTDGAQLPVEPPDDLTTNEERKAYAYLHDLVKRTAFAELVDLPALVLCSQRLAYVRLLTALVHQAQKDGEMFVQTSSGVVKAHPVLNELRASQSALNTSLGSLYLNPRSRANARGRGEVDPAGDGEGEDLLR